eukprot:TRINITY_DN1358_c0_g1_i1.p1 TRINITY_DN1358_c0_g1~~TRINITY_DN1358_c0_g1_i1.p1  ORF type:complete len:491 (+),score=118.52 TRINITY_DN1358_c0_g1_i1:127-1473(+)
MVGELVAPLLVGLAAFTFLALSIATGHEVAAILQTRAAALVKVKEVVSLVLFRTPFYIGLCLPMALLLAPLLGLGRMGSDNEIVVLRACSVSAWRLVKTAASIFGVIMLIHYAIAEGLTPSANSSATRTIRKARFGPSAVAESPLAAATVWRPLVYPEFRAEDGTLQRMFYAKGCYRGEMYRVALVEMEAGRKAADVSQAPIAAEPAVAEAPTGNANDGVKILSVLPSLPALRPERVVLADAALWEDAYKSWVFEDGTEYEFGEGKPVKGRQVAESTGGTGIGGKEGGEVVDSLMSSYTLKSVRHFDRKLFPGMSRLPLDLAIADGGRSLDDMSLSEVSRLENLLAESRNVKESRRIQVKIHQRLALPFACVILGVLGTSLSLRLPTDNKAVGYAITLGIVFAYYALSITGVLLAQLGVMHPVAGAWLPNLTGALVALLLLSSSRRTT